MVLSAKAGKAKATAVAAAKERVLWVFGRHAKAVDKLLEVDLDSGEKSSVKRAACAIRALKRTPFSEKLLQIYLADDETSDGVWGPLLSMNRSHPTGVPFHHWH